MKAELIVIAIVAVVAVFKWAQYKLTTTALIHMMLSKGMPVDEHEVKRHMERCVKMWANLALKRNH